MRLLFILLIFTVFVLGVWIFYLANQSPIIEKQDDDEILVSKILEMQEKINEMEKRLNSQSEKMKLLGGLYNENFSAIKMGKNNDIIFINRGWTINKMPKYLYLEKEDVEFFEKYKEKNKVNIPIP